MENVVLLDDLEQLQGEILDGAVNLLEGDNEVITRAVREDVGEQGLFHVAELRSMVEERSGVPGKKTHRRLWSEPGSQQRVTQTTECQQ